MVTKKQMRDYEQMLDEIARMDNTIVINLGSEPRTLKKRNIKR